MAWEPEIDFKKPLKLPSPLGSEEETQKPGSPGAPGAPGKGGWSGPDVQFNRPLSAPLNIGGSSTGIPIQPVVERTPEQQSVLARVLDGFMGVLEPLTLPGDLIKAGLYGFLTGGSTRALNLMWDVAKNALAYLPFGEKPTPPVKGDDLARLLIPDYDKMGGWAKLGLGLFFDVVADPLTLFAGASLAVRGLATGTRVVETAARAARLAQGEKVAGGIAMGLRRIPPSPLVQGLETAARTLQSLDETVNRYLNPYAAVIQGAQALGQLGVKLGDEDVRLVDLARRTLDSIFNIQLFTRQVRVSGYTESPSIKLGDFFLPHFPTLEARQKVEEVAPEWIGSIAGGAGAIPTVKARVSMIKAEGLRLVNQLNQVLNAHLGEPARFLGVFPARVIPEERQPLMHEIRAILTQVMRAPDVQHRFIMEEALPALQKLGEASGVAPRTVQAALQEAYKVAVQGRDSISKLMSNVDVLWDKLNDVGQEYGLPGRLAAEARLAQMAFEKAKDLLEVGRIDEVSIARAAQRARKIAPLLPDFLLPFKDERLHYTLLKNLEKVGDRPEVALVAPLMTEPGAFANLKEIAPSVEVALNTLTQVAQEARKGKYKVGRLAKDLKQMDEAEASEALGKYLNGLLQKVEGVDDPQPLVNALNEVRNIWRIPPGFKPADHRFRVAIPQILQKAIEVAPTVHGDTLRSLIFSDEPLDRIFGFLTAGAHFLSQGDYEGAVGAFSFLAREASKGQYRPFGKIAKDLGGYVFGGAPKKTKPVKPDSLLGLPDVSRFFEEIAGAPPNAEDLIRGWKTITRLPAPAQSAFAELLARSNPQPDSVGQLLLMALKGDKDGLQSFLVRAIHGLVEDPTLRAVLENPESAAEARRILRTRTEFSLRARLAEVATDEARAALEEAISGRRIPVDDDTVNAVASLIRQRFGDAALLDALKAAGWSKGATLADLRKQSTTFLNAIYEEAMRQTYLDLPLLGGVRWRDFLRGQIFLSPESYYRNKLEGYIRTSRLGGIDPQAATAAFVKGILTLPNETVVDELPDRVMAWAKLKNFLGAKPEAWQKATEDMTKYLSAMAGRATIYTPALARFFEANGIKFGPQEWADFVRNTLWTQADYRNVQEALKRYAAGYKEARLERSLLEINRNAFEEVRDAAAYLYTIEDFIPAVSEQVRYHSREYYVADMQQKVYQTFKDTGLLLTRDEFAKLPLDQARQFKEIPDRKVRPSGFEEPLEVWGPLGGHYLYRPIYDQVVRALGSDPMGAAAFADFLNFVRKGFLNNYKTMFAQVVGTLWFSYIYGGADAFWGLVKNLPWAAKVYLNYLKDGRVMQRKGQPFVDPTFFHILHEVNLNESLVSEVSQTLIRYSNDYWNEFKRQGLVRATIKLADKWLNETSVALAEKMGKEQAIAPKLIMPIQLFAAWDNISRLALWKHLSDTTGNRAAAAYAAMNWLYNYHEIPYAFRAIRDLGLVAFPSFMWFTAVTTGKVLKQRPSAALFPTYLADQTFYAFTDNDADHARAKAFMSDYLRSAMPAVAPVPTKEGHVAVIPLAYWFPLDPGLGQTLEEFSGLGLYAPLLMALRGAMAVGEDLSGKVGELKQTDIRYGPIVRPGASPGEKAYQIARYLGYSYAPSWLSRYLGAFDLPEALMIALTGDESRVANLKSVLGKLYAEYRHPEVVNILEGRYLKAIGMTAGEAALRMIQSPSRTPLSPYREAEIGQRLESQVRERMVQTFQGQLLKPEDAERLDPELRRLFKEYQRFVDKLQKLHQAFPPEEYPFKMPPVEWGIQGRPQ